MVHIRIPRLAASLVIVLAAGAAQAQSLVSQSSNPADPKKAIEGEAKLTRRPALPPGLPGARQGRAGAAPATEALGSMTPNEALFDAVNRGDIAGARDALSRGAEIDARNVLGLTALDLSVDLGRNDLTFLLLSLRNANQGTRMAKVAPSVNTAAATPPPPAVSRPAKPVGPVAARTVTPPPVHGATRYAGDPGTPAPAQGFLGFGGGITQ
jgi:ankyrin repeat protein